MPHSSMTQTGNASEPGPDILTCVRRATCPSLRSVSDIAPRPDRVTLSRDFSAFLVELSIALHKHAMYPTDHPSLGPAAAAVVRRADRLLEDRQMVALGVARRQLIIEGVATDPNQPVLRRLAETLHRHNLGAVSVSRGVLAEEVGSALRALASDPDRDGPLGLRPPDRFPEWRHLRLHPLTFDRLTLVTDAAPRAGVTGRNGWRGAELWIGLARAALAGEATAPAPETLEPSDPFPVEPAVVAHAIDEHPRAEAYDQVIVGYLLQIAQELKTAGGAETAALRRRTARLIAALNPETLRRLVEMGGNVAQRRTFVLDAAHGMAVDAVLEILKAASDVSGQTISHGLVRMLSKLASHAELGSEEARPLADAALREQVGRLLSGWQLIDPNPESYRRVLQRVTRQAPVEPVRPGTKGADWPEPLRMAQMSLEIGGVGPLVDRAIDRAVNQGTLGDVLDLHSALPPSAAPAASAMMARLVTPRTIASLMAKEPVDFVSLDRLLPALPRDSFNPLLDTLATSENRATRRKLLDRLSRVERDDIGSLITSRLYDERWFVQRNMLVLLERSGAAPPGFSAATWAEHLDARVRHQAVRLQLTLPHERDHALRTALEDHDPRLIRVGLAALQRTCPPELAPLVCAMAENQEVDEDLRLLAIHALAGCRARAAVDALLRMADGGKTLLGKPRLPQRTPVLLAVVRALANGWAADASAATVLSLARQSSDSEIRKAAGVVRP